MIKKNFVFGFFCFMGLISAVSLISATPHIALAKELANPPVAQWVKLKQELKNRKSPLTSKVVQRRLDRIHRVMNQKDSQDKTLELIQKLENITKKRPFELARLYKLKAQVYFSKDDFKNAFRYYNKAIALKTLPYKDHLSILYNQAVLYMLKGNIKKASRLIDQLSYLSDTIPGPVYILKAFILTEKNQKPQALKMVMKAINSTARPKESWLALSAGLNIELKKYVPATQMLTKLTSTYPNKAKYWKQLSAVYLNIKKDDRALAVLDLAYKQEFLEKEQEIVHLVGLLMYQGLPLKAGRLMEQALKLKKIKPTPKNYEILGDCHIRAEETNKALKAYQQSAPTAKDGKIFAKIGRIYMQQQNYKQSINNFTNALNKGGIKRPEYIHIAIGTAHTHLKQYTQAVKAFEQVVSTQAKGQTIKIARQWINYVQSLMNTVAVNETTTSKNSH